MFQAELHVGRLVEIRARDVVTLDEVRQFRGQLMGILGRTFGRQVVICTDWRGAEPLEPELYSMLLGVMRSDNPRVERSGHISSGPADAQVLELLRQAKNPSRRHFTKAEELLLWIGELLDEVEQARARTFLGLPPVVKAAPPR